MTQKPKIALIAGGYSKESSVSVKSASVIMEHIDKNKFDVYLISITQEAWTCLVDNTIIEVNKNDFSIFYEQEQVFFDCAFIMIHGTPGENGLLQGYFDMLTIPYTTCDAAVSAVTFHKYFCNHIVKSFGQTHVADSLCISKDQSYSIEEISNQIGFPCFVKPNSGGSSIGTTKVHKQEQLQNAIDLAFAEDDDIMVERFIGGTEITCGVFQNQGKIVCFPLTMVVSKKEFFDFESKYDPNLADEITPAPISQTLAQRIQEISIHYYKQLKCCGVVRFDYIVDDDDIWFLEVNTVPGMSAESIVPQQAESYGWSYTELTTKIIEDCLFRYGIYK
jgi:D-alanine-D-alanine ligase